MSRRFQFSLKMMLVSLALLAASGGAAVEGGRQAMEDHARLSVTLFLVSGAMLGAAICFMRGRAVLRGAMWGLLFWPAIAMALFLFGVLYSGSFVVAVY